MKVETDSITSTVKHVPVYKGQSKKFKVTRKHALYELLPFILFRLELDALYIYIHDHELEI
jgi:hypothetical protein